MKKILIVNKSFALGGIESAMLNMISNLSKEYIIDLCLYYPEGPLKNRISNNINIIKVNPYIEAMGMSFKECILRGSFKQKIFRIFGTIWTKLFNNNFPINFALKKQKKLKDYDIAIAYHHETNKKTLNSGFVRFVDYCVEANKKIAWIHYDPDMVCFDEKYNDIFYKKMDKIVCVSEVIKNKFIKYHTELSEKLEVCYNFLDFERIYKLCGENQKIKYDKKNINLFSACRLTKEKGLPRAIKAVADLLREYPELKWYIAGEGQEKNEILKIISDEKLENKVILLGHLDNPYPYIKNADMLMVVSYHEAAPMVYMEAKALNTYIFTTNISSTSEILKDGLDAFICENSGKGIHNMLKNILKESERLLQHRDKIVTPCTNEKTIRIIKNIFEN